MDFVTKKQFEEALAIIDRAAKNGQVIEGRIEEGRMQLPLEHLYFGSNPSDIYESNQVAFVNPFDIAKNRLYNLQSYLKKQKERASLEQKELEKLEQEEKKLKELLPTLK